MAETTDPASFSIEGTIACMQAENGHVFWYGIHLPFEVPGTNGPDPAQPRDWLSRVLSPYRSDAGRKVRLTLEIAAAEIPAAEKG